MTPEDFYALFETSHRSVARLEALPAYAVADYEGERLDAFTAGRALPPRTVLTDSWLAGIARSAMAGKSWSRLRVVDVPLTDYQRFELEVFKESQAVGEQIHVVRRHDTADTGPDFWLFDADTPNARAAVMSYDDDGRWLGVDLVDDLDEIGTLAGRLRASGAAAVPLNHFLAAAGG